MVDTLSDNTIRACSCPDCYVCGAQGKTLYRGLNDRLFGSPGEWNLKTCPNPECRLVWLDPMPLEEDIGKAYKTYFTHGKNKSNSQDKGLKEAIMSNLGKTYRAMLRVTPLYYERKKRSLMYLDKVTPGRLLEVGCGNGNQLAQMHALGWKVEGQEVDPKAAEHARNAHGLPVHLGALEEIAFPDATFDVIIMSHVIEHVYDPIALLTECYRILKPNGVLLIFTPNIESHGHRRFKSCWFALDPPRHLYLFSRSSLHACAKRAGYGSIKIWTTPAYTPGIFLASQDIRIRGVHKIGEAKRAPLFRFIQASGFQFRELFLRFWISNIGEELVLKATK